jgi:RNA polymerase primary sigma factor
MDYKEVRNLVEVTKNEGSIDAPIAESDDSSLKMIDVLEDQRTPGPTDGLADESLKTEIEKALAHLEEKEAEIIRLSFGIKGMYPMSIGDIGDQLGITQERVRQIRLKALKRLRKVSNLDQLKDFL